MINPWQTLPKQAPFALESDLQSILEFNKSATPDTLVHLELLPEPFIGNLNAPIVLLALNPGFSPDDPKTHLDNQFIKVSRSNLKNDDSEYPFFFLNPKIEAPGREWWEQKLSRLIAAKGREAVARKLLCVEYFPYHSRKFAHTNLRVPSQVFTFELVYSAIRRNALIVLLRSAKLWFKSVPELETYKRLYRLNSSQNVMITPANCPNGYDKILGEI